MESGESLLLLQNNIWPFLLLEGHKECLASNLPSDELEQNENTCPELSGASDEDSGDDWDEIQEESEPVPCLFCNENVKDISDALEHLDKSHKFNLRQFIVRHSIDTYSYIKLINFIRHKSMLPDQLSALTAESWQSDEFLRPAVEDDPWIMFDLEDLQDKVNKPMSYTVNSENGCVTLSEAHFADLQRTIQTLKAQLEHKELTCFLAEQRIDEMTKKVQKLVLDDDTDGNVDICSRKSGNGDIGYFSAYSHFAIHHEMLTDKVRTESYRDALLTNANRFENSVVLDVGCGTGILSMFAAKTGCRKVIGVDRSDVIYRAMSIVRENNLSDIITLQKGLLEDIKLSEEKVDVIISEWMGYFLLYEGMLDTIIHARDHYLAPDGILLPNRCTLSLVGSGDTRRYVELVDYWSNVYGFKMSCMKAEVVREPTMEFCNTDELITSVAEIQAFDLYKVTTDCFNFCAPFELAVKKTGSLTAIVGYFDIFFDLDNPIHFSTGPHSTPTHWKQTVFFLREPLSITEGEIISGQLVCRRHTTDGRGLIVTITIKNTTAQSYYLE